MDFPLVIKVKYGDTLRRFTASVGENGLLDLDMARLINQIHALFSFPPTADLTLTYTDEDNDEVTLVDDKDLYDATRQKLNPLRIQVVKSRISPAIFKFTSSSARNVPRPTRTDSADAEGLKCDVEIYNPEICPEASHDLQKEDAHFVATKTVETLSEMEENLDKLKAKSIENESSKPTNPPCPIQPRKANPLGITVPAKSAARMESAVDVRKPTPTETVDGEGSKSDSEIPNLEISPEAHDVATKIKIMEAMSKMGENSDKVNFKSVANENSKPTNNLSCHSFPCPIPAIKTPPTLSSNMELEEADHLQINVPVSVQLPGPSKNFNDLDASLLSLSDTAQGVKAPHTSTDGLMETQSVDNSILSETGQVELASEAVNSKPAIDKGKSEIQVLEIPVNNDSSILDGVSVPVSPVVPVLVSNPASESSFVQSEPSTGANTCFLEVDVDYEQMLLCALERMGFKQIDLNKEILRKNLFDLNQSITDLCDLGEWDEVLNELEQMGFCDKVTNIELLKKNEGNIKDVIMTLISEETE